MSKIAELNAIIRELGEVDFVYHGVPHVVLDLSADGEAYKRIAALLEPDIIDHNNNNEGE